ncbi:TRAP transporter substrate-binding protein DctP [Desertibaculum subflavum]|uniref:TRAP transporter substrate-binding protein DctP n=1 Tax=Desertibaculum subflavum TaxID=2268458 RepID=UPI000E66A08A
MRMTYRRTALVAAVLGLAPFLPSRGMAAETVLFNCFFPPQHYMCREFVPELGKRVEKASEGRVKVQIPPKSAAAPGDQYDAVVNGVVDGALQFNQFLGNMAPGVLVGQLPFVGAESSRSTTVALWRTYQKFFAPKNEYKKVVLLALYSGNGAEFFSTIDKPIMTVEDIRDRKMWALPGVTADLVKATGSSVVSGPAVQMLEIISKGVVDGYTGVPSSTAEEFKLRPYTKSVTVFKDKIFQPTFSFFISEIKWAKFTPKDQAAIKAALGEDYGRFISTAQDAKHEANNKKIWGAGVKRIVGSDAELAKLEALGKPVVDAWVEKIKAIGVDGREVIAFYKKAIAEEGALAAK